MSVLVSDMLLFSLFCFWDFVCRTVPVHRRFRPAVDLREARITDG